jgi:NAD(P)-dependent dehydrogenase (short-subunit alcohol dehydrogenase family)
MTHKTHPPDALLAQLAGLGDFGGSLELDLAVPSSIDALVEKVASFSSKLSAVVINSGVYCLAGLSQDGFEKTANVNTLGVARLTRELLPLLTRNATVIFSSSASSRNWSGPQEALLNVRSTLEELFVSDETRCLMRYARSKALLNAFVIRMAKDHPEHRFLAAIPDPTQTDMVEEAVGMVARVLHYPPFFSPGSHLFDAFSLFWIKALTRSVEKVGRQYVYGLISTTLPSGSLYFKEVPLMPLRYEEEAANKIQF